MPVATKKTYQLPFPRNEQPNAGLSLTAVSTYRNCPLRYHFQYEAKLPQTTVPASVVFGRAVRRAIATHFRQLAMGSPIPSGSQLMSYYQAEMDRPRTEEIVYGTENRATLDLVASRMLKGFLEHPSAVPPGRVLEIEKELVGSISPRLPDFSGSPVVLIESRQELIIRDFRASRCRWTEEQLETASETLLLLGEVARQSYPLFKSLRPELVILHKTRDATIEMHSIAGSRSAINRAKHIAQAIWRAIESRAYFPNPAPITCSGCPFRQPCRVWPVSN